MPAVKATTKKTAKTAAKPAPDRVIEYALSKGFYMIMPSGEDVKVTKPVSGPGIW
jgi:hypothetical protein